MKPATNLSALDQCLRISAAHARLQLALDEELGIHHGLSYADFLLLHRLAGAQDHRLSMGELAPELGLRASALLLQILPLEKIGLVEREAPLDKKGRRHVHLRAAGRQVVSNAIETAQALCLALAPSVAVTIAAAGRLGSD